MHTLRRRQLLGCLLLRLHPLHSGLVRVGGAAVYLVPVGYVFSGCCGDVHAVPREQVLGPRRLGVRGVLLVTAARR